MTTIKPAIEMGARAAIANRTEELFRASGAIREGHFQLKSGRHGDAYVEKFAVLSDPAATSELCGFWAGTHRDDGGVARVDSWAPARSSPKKSATPMGRPIARSGAASGSNLGGGSSWSTTS